MENRTMSRRDLIKTGVLTGLSAAAGMSLVSCMSTPPAATAAPTNNPQADKDNDIRILNAAVDLEHQAIWAYTTAAGTGKLDGMDAVSKLVKNQALQNLADHNAHRDALVGAVRSLGGTASVARSSYDISGYLNAGLGNLDNLVNIAKLALALEFDAALAYNDAFSNLRSVDLIKAAATIGPDEAAHATAIRALLIQANAVPAGTMIVPSPLVSKDSRSKWLFTV